jgi:vibriolysin
MPQLFSRMSLGLAILLSLCATAYAAEKVELHGHDLTVVDKLNRRGINKGESKAAAPGIGSRKSYLQSFRGEVLDLGDDHSFHAFRENTDKAKVKHTRYQQMFKNIPVFAKEVVLHEDHNGRILDINGSIAKGIEQELGPNVPLVPAYSATEALEQAKRELSRDSLTKRRRHSTHESTPTSNATAPASGQYNYRNEQSELNIYVGANNQPRLVYYVNFLAEPTEGGEPTRPYQLIDATTGQIIKRWEGLTHQTTGTGPGGNAKVGQYEYGTNYGYLDVLQNGSLCSMQNASVSTVNMTGMSSSHATPFSYDCPRNTVKTINGAFSPLNDAHYFGGVIVNMYSTWYGFPPIPLPLVMRPHYGTNYENAFWDGLYMTFGDGYSTFYPLVSLDVAAHEVSHGFTEHNSNLIYDGESGGINEAFSDMAGESAKYFLHGSNNWKVGADITKTATALRYLDNPPADGYSIGDYINYTDSLDVHYSSGLFNKAFYLLATKPGWNTKKAFDVMVKANKDYWVPASTFRSAACGAISAATDLSYSSTDVDNAFRGVNVYCGAPEINSLPTVLSPATIFAGSSTVAYISTPFSQTFSVSGGTLPYIWSLYSGILPTGLMLNASTGEISGIPTVVGEYKFTLQVEDSTGRKNFITWTILIYSGQIQISPSTIPNGSYLDVYLKVFSATNGFSPYTWSRISGSLPPGTDFTGSWVLSGVPSAIGNFSLVTKVTDKYGVSAIRSYSFSVVESAVRYLNYIWEGSGGGTVTISPGMTCSANCSVGGAAGRQVTLSATPDADSVFTGWSGACAGTGNCIVTMNVSKQVNARFDKVVNGGFLLTIMKDGLGQGTVSYPSGTTCPSSCSRSYEIGSTVNLTPLPAAGSVFQGWTNCDTVTNTVCSVAMTGTRTVKASFAVEGATIRSLHAGGNNSHAVRSDGTAWSWGSNSGGQIGDGTTTGHIVPFQVPGVTDIYDVMGGNRSLVLHNDGSLSSWGFNYWGQLGDSTTIDNLTPAHLLSSGGFIAASAGNAHTLAFKGDGSIWGWGNSLWLGDGTTDFRMVKLPARGPVLPGVTYIVADGQSSAALKGDGTVWTWGDNYLGQLGDGTTIERHVPVQVQGISGVVAISLSIALKQDGTVWAWGSDHFGQIRTTPVQVSGLSNIKAIAVGGLHTMALDGNGVVWTWGFNNYGQLGDGSTLQRITPVQVSGLSNIVTIAAGSYHSLAMDRSGTIWAWGENTYGQLGDGTTSTRFTPVQVQNFWDITPPSATIDGTPASPTNATSATLIIGGTDVVAYKYNLDTGPYSIETSVASPISLNSLSEGTHMASLLGKNRIGNWQVTPTIANWAVGRPVSIPGSGDFTSIFDAYNSLLSDNVLQIKEVRVVENLIFNRNLTVTLRGGFDPASGTCTGFTSLQGSLVISNGTVIVENLILL